MNRGIACWFGTIECYPPTTPVPPRNHGPSLYAGYGQSRLNGRILALPAGTYPPGPAAIDRFTIGWLSPPPTVRGVSPPVRPKRYAHPSYMSNRYSRYEHH